MGINTQEKIKLERELSELRAKHARAVEVDKVLDAALASMRKSAKEHER